MSHTKEPWRYIEYCCIYSGDYFVADCRHVFDLRKRAEKDAQRIVACVNACAGIETDRLESGSAEWWGEYIKRDRPAMECDLAALRDETQRMRDYLEGIMAIAGNPNAIAACRLIIKEAQAALGKDADK
jgi:hypothetical protein